MTLGGVNSTFFEGNVNWIPLTSRSYWEVQVQAVSVGGVPVDLVLESAAIDTGTSLIGVPEAAAALIYERIPGSRRHTKSFYTFPCE